MKRIFLMRHGKAEEGFSKSDFDRNLQAKGEKKTKKIARFLIEKEAQPQLILTSAANRTVQTAEIVGKALGIPDGAILESKELYLASEEAMLNFIYAIDNQNSEIMIVGHNPGISALASYLSDSDINWMSTSSVIAIDIDTRKWNDLDLASKKLLFYAKPSSI